MFSRFGFKSGICLLIAPVPVHCFSITSIEICMKNHLSSHSWHFGKKLKISNDQELILSVPKSRPESKKKPT